MISQNCALSKVKSYGNHQNLTKTDAKRRHEEEGNLDRHFQPILSCSFLKKFRVKSEIGNSSELESNHHHHFLCAITASTVVHVLQINVNKLDDPITIYI